MQRFSSRLRWDAPPNRLHLLYEERRRGGAEILDLSESNPTRVGLAYPRREILAALSDPQALLYEPAPRGGERARTAIARYCARLGRPADPERFVLTAGTSEAYAFLFNLLLEPGDALLVPRPSYPLLDLLAGLESVHLRPYALAHDGRWRIDLDSLRSGAREGARAVVVVHPNNPTGSFVSRREFADLLTVCAEHGLALISDEVFVEYAHAPDPERQPTLAGGGEVLTFTLDGLSKSAGLPQIKLGWIQVSGPEAACRQALSRLDLLADAFLSVSGPSQSAAPRLLELGGRVREAIRGRLRVNLDRLRSALERAPGCALVAPEGGWTAVLRLPRTRSDEEWALSLLERDGVRVQPGYFYDFEEEAVLVLSLLPEPRTFSAGVERLVVRSLSG